MIEKLDNKPLLINDLEFQEWHVSETEGEATFKVFYKPESSLKKIASKSIKVILFFMLSKIKLVELVELNPIAGVKNNFCCITKN